MTQPPPEEETVCGQQLLPRGLQRLHHNMCTSHPHSSLHWWRSLGSVQVRWNFPNQYLGVGVYGVQSTSLCFSSHPHCDLVRWAAVYYDPILLMCKLRLQVKELEHSSLWKSQHPTQVSATSSSSPISIKNINKVFSFLSSRLKQHFPI